MIHITFAITALRTQDLVFIGCKAISQCCTLFFSGTAIVSFVAFWGFNAFLLLLDVTGRPKFLQRYKIQEEKNVPVRVFLLT